MPGTPSKRLSRRTPCQCTVLRQIDPIVEAHDDRRVLRYANAADPAPAPLNAYIANVRAR